MRKLRNAISLLVLLFIFLPPAHLFCRIKSSETNSIIEVDFLQQSGLQANALAPHVVRVDPVRNRVIAACTNSSALAVYESNTDQVKAIPIGSRMPRRLHFLGVTVDSKSGWIYLAGEEKLIGVNPDKAQYQVTALPADFETVAVDARNGAAFLVGRTTGELAIVIPGARQPELLSWGDPAESLPWAAASPPPPVRNIVVDAALNKVFIVDGTVPQLISVDLEARSISGKRRLPLENFPRWHFAGFDTVNHWLYFALEDAARNARQALRIDLKDSNDVLVDLPPGSREPVGVSCSIKRQEIYIPYDNHKHLHRVHFSPSIQVDSIATPAFGMDASAIDAANDLLYVTSWHTAELYIIDLATGKIIRTIPDFPIYPHTNHFVYNPADGRLYIPTGAAVVNGTFGASLTVFDSNQNEFSVILTGWGPVSLIQKPNSDTFYVFSSDRQFAEVTPDGKLRSHWLPYPYAHDAVHSHDKQQVYVAYGPHSSMYPSIYIASTRNGIFSLGENPLKVKDRLTDRLAQGICVDPLGQLWALQNTWGTEHPFISVFPPGQNKWQRVFFPEKVDNECIFRLLACDPIAARVYVGRVGDRADEPGMLHAIDIKTHQIVQSLPLGITPTDICVLPEKNKIAVTNFDSDSVTIINGESFQIEMKPAGRKPIAVAAHRRSGEIYVVSHLDNGLVIFGKREKRIKLPGTGLPNNIFVDELRHKVYITTHDPARFCILKYEPDNERIQRIFEYDYPYGEVTFDQSNSAFAERAQWGDAIFRLTSMAMDDQRRLWVTDYLAGKLWIITAD
ncbi:hypothetical protein JXJ21_05340 [candidate division KSB1 bacterium]|nr:hypothetical protein [candidate division KSB1 bacterium]